MLGFSGHWCHAETPPPVRVAFIKKDNSRAKREGSRVKMLTCKQEGQNSNPQDPCRSWMHRPAVILALLRGDGRWRQEDP